MVKYSLSILILFSFELFSQNTILNLDSCLNRAFKTNLRLLEQEINIDKSKIISDQTKLNLLPDLNGYSSYGYNWGQTIDPFTNQFASNRVQTNSFYLNSNWTLFSGLHNYYTTLNSKLDLALQESNYEAQVRNIKIDLTAYYLQALLNSKVIEIKFQHLRYSNSLKNRTQELINLGQKPQYDIIEIRSQIAYDSLNYIHSKNDYETSLNSLRKIMGIDNSYLFELENTSIYSKTLIDNNLNNNSIDYEILPEIKSFMIKQKLAENNIKMNLWKLSPSLTFTSSFGTGYSGNNKSLVNSQIVVTPFDEQFKKNIYQSAKLSLYLPIYNKGNTKSQLDLAKIEKSRIQIQLNDTKLNLENKIVQASIDIKNIINQINVSEYALKSLKELYELNQIKYDQGLIDISKILEVKNKLYETEIEFAKAQIEYVFKTKIFNYLLNK